MEQEQVTTLFGIELKRAREAVGLTQAKLGNMMGLSGKTICLWEQGKQTPPVRLLAALMDLVDLPDIRRLVWVELLRGER